MALQLPFFLNVSPVKRVEVFIGSLVKNLLTWWENWEGKLARSIDRKPFSPVEKLRKENQTIGNKLLIET